MFGNCNRRDRSRSPAKSSGPGAELMLPPELLQKLDSALRWRLQILQSTRPEEAGRLFDLAVSKYFRGDFEGPRGNLAAWFASACTRIHNNNSSSGAYA